MKTIQELIRDADNLNTLMNQAAANKNEIHPLTKIDDAYVADVYLTLLTSVAESSEQFDETEDNPLAYICRIAAALNKTPDMPEILRRSLLIDEKVLNDYAVTLNQHNLQNMLLFDSVIMLLLYAKDNPEALNYVAGIAEIVGTSKDALKEILTVAKNVLSKQPNFECKFEALPCYEFLPYIRRNCRNIFIEAPDIFFVDLETLTDFTEKINFYFGWKNMKLVHFRNVYLHNTIYSFNATDTETVEFEGCTFRQITAYALIRDFARSGNLFFVPDDFKFLKCERCHTVSFVNCTFTDNTGNFIDFSDGSDYFFAKYDDRGLLVWIDDIYELVVRDCTFKNCYFREMFPNATYGLYSDGHTYMTFSEKFGNRNNFTYMEYVERARVDLTRGSLFGGWTETADISNNSIINSLQL